MKHIKDAQILLDQGDSVQALEVIDNLLSFSPNNPEALRLKANILDSWGHFDESFILLQKILKIAQTDEKIVNNFQTRMEEERASLVFSQLTPLGRWYFPFSAIRLFASLSVFIGCIFFLISASQILSKPNGSLLLGISFVSLVLLPWLFSLFLSFRGIKRIFVGFDGISVFYGFKSAFYSWNDMGQMVIEYDPNLRNQYLRMIIYSKSTRQPLLNFDISQRSSVIKARRHFVRLVSSYLGNVMYVTRGKATENSHSWKGVDTVVERSRNDKAA